MAPLRHSGKRPIKVGKRPIKEGKRPIKLSGLLSGTPLWRKTVPLKRPIKRSMKKKTLFARINSQESPFFFKIRALFANRASSEEVVRFAD